jgi:hypothetical protein
VFVEADAGGDVDEEFVFRASSLLAFSAAILAPFAGAVFSVAPLDGDCSCPRAIQGKIATAATIAAIRKLRDFLALIASPHPLNTNLLVRH